MSVVAEEDKSVKKQNSVALFLSNWNGDKYFVRGAQKHVSTKIKVFDLTDLKAASKILDSESDGAATWNFGWYTFHYTVHAKACPLQLLWYKLQST